MYRSRPDTAQGSAQTEQEARSHAEQTAEREDNVPRSMRKTLGGRKQDAAFRKAMQKAVKADRKSGGLVRGMDYDVEAMGDGGMPGGSGLEEEEESSDEGEDGNEDGHDNGEVDGEEDSGSCGSEDGDEDQPATCKKSVGAKKQDATYYIPFLPKDLGDSVEECEERKKKVESKLMQQLKAWAIDMNCDHAKAVRAMYFAWHPDKQVGRVWHPFCTDIFQSIQAEVRRLQAERERRMAKFEQAKRARADKKQEKFADKQVRRERHERRVAKTTGQEGGVDMSIPTKATTKSETSEALSDDAEGPTSCDATPSTTSSLKQESTEQDIKKSVRFSATTEEHPIEARAADEDSEEEEDDSSDDDDCPDLVTVETPRVQPPARSHFSLTRFGDSASSTSFLLFGGEAANGEDDKIAFHKDVFTLSAGGASASSGAAAKFSELELSSASTEGPCARSAHQSAPVGENGVLVFGGEWASADGRRFRQFDDTWHFDNATNSWTKLILVGDDAPCARSGHRMVVLGEKVFLFGGFAEQKNGNVKYLSDFYGGELQYTAPGGNGGNKKNRKIGGQADAVASGDGAAKKLTGIKWVRDKRQKIAKPAARAGFSMWTRGTNELYIFGGSCTGAKGDLKVLTDLWMFNTETLEWSEVKTTGLPDAFSVAREICDAAPASPNGSGKEGGAPVSKSAKKKAKKKAKAAGNAGGGGDDGAKADAEEAAEEKATAETSTATEEASNASENTAPKVRIERKFVPRSGISCAPCGDNRVLFFGGVSDVVQDKGDAKKNGLAVFHSDVVMLDMETLTWSIFYSPYSLLEASMEEEEGPPSSIALGDGEAKTSDNSCTQEQLNKDVLKNQQLALVRDAKLSDETGGVDLVKLLLGNAGQSADQQDTNSQSSSSPRATTTPRFPRGRIGAQAVVAEEKLFVFGGTYEVGPRRECALDDLWSLSLVNKQANNKNLPEGWKCELRFSREKEEAELEEIEEEMAAEERENREKAGDRAIQALMHSLKSGGNKSSCSSSSCGTNKGGTKTTEKAKTSKKEPTASSTTDQMQQSLVAVALPASDAPAAPAPTPQAPPRQLKPTPSTVREAQENAEDCNVVALVDVADPSQLSKKERQKWEKKQRSEVKAVKQMEKAAKKDQKKEAKKDQQRKNAKGGDE
ncbi:unnamed protein product [Amoebophrya sp. A25]|nr:unnamed protein product [Amoebophrya sp. A25]|eukprot:GSA25T00021163001.1